jgi:hydroxymethylglutaryl-CoA lyase
MSYPKSVRIVDVGPRDGLQNEQAIVPLEAKVALIEGLMAAGVRSIEAGSFVSLKWLPQMADSAQVLQRVKRMPGVNLSVLVPNLQGLEAALSCDIQEVAVFAAASESFSRRNINCSIAASLERFRPVADAALAKGLRVRGYISCVLGCPYEGAVSAAAVMHVANQLIQMGCYEISLGDTIGVGTALQAQKLIRAITEVAPIERIAVHFHDTWGQALANILACIDLGVAVIDSSVGGLGGCPYAPGASGNVATEDVVYLLEGMGIDTGIDLRALAQVGDAISACLGRKSASKVAAALAASGKNRATFT